MTEEEHQGSGYTQFFYIPRFRYAFFFRQFEDLRIFHNLEVQTDYNCDGFHVNPYLLVALLLV